MSFGYVTSGTIKNGEKCMKSKFYVIASIVFLTLFCSCDTQQLDTVVTETEAFSEMQPHKTANKTGMLSETAETTIISATDTTMAAITETIAMATTQAVTEPIPIYDKITAPVLTVSNIDHKTNYMVWTAIEGAQSYMLYILNEETGEFEEYGDMNGTACNDVNLEPNTKYTYAVAAKFPDGSMGTMSETESIYTYNYIGRNLWNNYNAKLAEQGEWVYFVGADDHLCKMRHDGTDFSVICPDISREINALGEYIYYIEKNDGYDYICRIRSDGTGKEILYDTKIRHEETGDPFPPFIYQLTVVEDRIYFVMEEISFFESPSKVAIYSMKNDGTDLKKVYSDSGDFLEIHEDTIYLGQHSYHFDFEGYDSGFGIIYDNLYIIKKLSGDTEEMVEIPSKPLHELYFDESMFIFYDDEAIYSYDMLTKEKEYLGKSLNDNEHPCMIRDGSIYYFDHETSSLMKRDMSGNIVERITDDLIPAAVFGTDIWLVGNENEIYKPDTEDNLTLLYKPTTE